MTYYKGQRLRPTPENPVRYSPKDFAVFEGSKSDDRLLLTIVQKRTRDEPSHWWEPHFDEIKHFQRNTGFYRERVQVCEVMAVLSELAPFVVWVHLPPLPHPNRPPNPYRFEGIFGGHSRSLEVELTWVEAVGRGGLRSLLSGLVDELVNDLCREG